MLSLNERRAAALDKALRALLCRLELEIFDVTRRFLSPNGPPSYRLAAVAKKEATAIAVCTGTNAAATR